MFCPLAARLLAAGSPSVIKHVRAGLMIAAPTGCLQLPGADGSVAGPLFPISATLKDMLKFGEKSTKLNEPTRLQDNHKLSEKDRDLRRCAEAVQSRALELLDAEDWQPIDAEGEDQLLTKLDDNGRRVWKFRTVIRCEADKMAAELIHNCDDCPSWNSAVKTCKTHATAAGVEILHQETGPLLGGLVTRREFVSVRRRGRRGDMHYSAVAAVEHDDFPRRSDCVRGENFPTVFAVRPCADSAEGSLCVVEGTLNCDLKLRMVPSSFIERGMHSVWRQMRSQMIQLGERISAEH